MLFDKNACYPVSFTGFISNGKTEHTIQVVKNIFTPLLVTVDYDLRIGFGAKHMPMAF